MLKELTVKELKEKLDNHEDLQLIDVREPMEFEFCQMGGELIPLGDLPKNVAKISREKPVVFICHHGFRSAQAIQYLTQRHQFDNLYNLKGGIHAWAVEVDPTVGIY